MLALRLCGSRVRLIRLEAAGLSMEAEPVASPVREVLCTAAGPAAGLLWAVVALAAGRAWGVKSAAAAMVINGFNLLPALPLDGGVILYILTRSKAVAVACSWAVVGLLTAGVIAYRAWGLLVPAVLIARTVLSS